MSAQGAVQLLGLLLGPVFQAIFSLVHFPIVVGACVASAVARCHSTSDPGAQPASSPTMSNLRAGYVLMT